MLKVVSKLLSVVIVAMFVKVVHADDTKESNESDSTIDDTVNIFDTNSQFMQGFDKGWSLEEDPDSDIS